MKTWISRPHFPRFWFRRWGGALWGWWWEAENLHSWQISRCWHKGHTENHYNHYFDQLFFMSRFSLEQDFFSLFVKTEPNVSILILLKHHLNMHISMLYFFKAISLYYALIRFLSRSSLSYRYDFRDLPPNNPPPVACSPLLASSLKCFMGHLTWLRKRQMEAYLLK